jgi:hypothetical protein
VVYVTFNVAMYIVNGHIYTPLTAISHVNVATLTVTYAFYREERVATF